MNHQHTVIAVALPLFLRYGYRKTSMEDIATATGFFECSRYIRGIPIKNLCSSLLSEQRLLKRAKLTYRSFPMIL